MSDSFFENYNEMSVGVPLSRYTEAISKAVAMAPGLNGAWIIAELSDVKTAGGHCYMELIEKNETGQTIAKLRATIWRSTYIQLNQKFYNATQRGITSGIKALLKGSATHHSVYGLSFNIVDIDPSYTLGDLERLRREIILQLKKEGIAFMNKSLPLPIAPQKIAVISAQGAAGYGDFINHLYGNSEGFVFYPCLFPCSMQGDNVSESIRYALQLIESTADIWDCIAIVRGGGATTDLNGFDDYELAKAVATCGLPIIVGIGHERDRNVLDEIAHTSLKTPTAVAGFFIDKAREAYDKVMGLADRLSIYSTQLIRGEERRLSSIFGIIPQLALRRLEDSKSRLQTILGKLPLLTKGRIGKEEVKLDGMKNILVNIANAKIGKESIRIEGISPMLTNFSSMRIEKEKNKISSIESLVKVLDPKNILKRGYSITRINGKTLKSATKVIQGDELTTILSDGEVRSLAVLKDLD